MRTILAKSIEGRELHMHVNQAFHNSGLRSPQSRASTLLIGGTHGDERATVPILENFIKAYIETEKLTAPTAVLSLLNPDGYAKNIRYNARGVDLNRNFPHQWSPHSVEASGPSPLSEPETRALHDFIVLHRPAKIISLHWALAEIDADGPQSTGLAHSMWECLNPEEKLPYRLRVHREAAGAVEFCSGSLGQWCGYGMAASDQLPPAMVTLELPFHSELLPRPVTLPEDHLDTLRDQWDSQPDKYLQGVEGSVHRMLEAACLYRLQPTEQPT